MTFESDGESKPPMTTDHLIQRIYAWGNERGLHDTIDIKPQLTKLGEEFGELCAGVARDDEHRIIDAVGDMMVVLVQIGAVCDIRYMHGYSDNYVQRALAGAWDEIKRRKGRTNNGVFLKEGDSDGDQNYRD